MIDTALLPPLVALLEEQSVSAAAVQLHVTQPAMSRTLARLRVATGDELLVKVGRGLRRTVRGDALLEPAREALAKAAAVLARPEPFHAPTASGAVTMALGDDLQAIAAGPILARLRKRAPGLDVRLRLLAHSSVDDARRGQIDLAITPLLPAGQLPDLSDFVVRPLYERRFVVVGRRRRTLTLDAFCAHDHVLVSPGGDATGFVDTALAAVGRKRRVAVTVQSFGTALQVLARSDTLIATLPLDVARVLAPRLFVQPCPVVTPRFQMCLTWLARVSTDPRHKFLRDVVREAIDDVVGT